MIRRQGRSNIFDGASDSRPRDRVVDRQAKENREPAWPRAPARERAGVRLSLDPADGPPPCHTVEITNQKLWLWEGLEFLCETIGAHRMRISLPEFARQRKK